MQMLNPAGEFVLLTFALKYFNLEETKEEKKNDTSFRQDVDSSQVNRGGASRVEVRP